MGVALLQVSYRFPMAGILKVPLLCGTAYLKATPDFCGLADGFSPVARLRGTPFGALRIAL